MTEPRESAAEKRSARERDQDTSRANEGRSRRIPLGRARQKLSAKQIDGYVTRWINDENGRVQQAQEGGYEFVTQEEAGHIGEDNSDGNTDLGDHVSKTVGSGTNGHPMRAFLMKIRKEYYEEDQAAKQSQIDEVENAIRRGMNVDGSAGEHTYVPSEGIKLEH